MAVPSWILPRFPLHPLKESKRLPGKFENVSPVSEAVQELHGQALLAKDLRPVPKLQIRRDNECHPFVNRGAELKQQLSQGEGRWFESRLPLSKPSDFTRFFVVLIVL